MKRLGVAIVPKAFFSQIISIRGLSSVSKQILIWNLGLDQDEDHRIRMYVLYEHTPDDWENFNL